MSGQGRCTASGTRRGGAPLLQRPAAQPTSCTVPTAHPPRAGVQFRRQVGPQRVRGRHRRWRSRAGAHSAQKTRASAPGHDKRPPARSNPATAPWTRGMAGRSLKAGCPVACVLWIGSLHCYRGSDPSWHAKNADSSILAAAASGARWGDKRRGAAVRHAGRRCRQYAGGSSQSSPAVLMLSW